MAQPPHGRELPGDGECKDSIVERVAARRADGAGSRNDCALPITHQLLGGQQSGHRNVSREASHGSGISRTNGIHRIVACRVGTSSMHYLTRKLVWPEYVPLPPVG